MKKFLCVLLTLALLPWSMALALETAIPEGYSASVTYTEKEGFFKQAGETPWSFEWTPVGKDEYQPLEFIDSGWFHETFQNWSYGTVQFPGSMHAGMIGDPVVAFTAPSDGKIVIAKATASKGATNLSDGVQIKILKNDEQLFPQKDWAVLMPDSKVAIPDLVLDVTKGDVIRFRVNCIKTQDADGLSWPKTISYLSKDAAAVPAAGVTVGFAEGVTLSAPQKFTDDFTGENPDSPWKFQNAEVGWTNTTTLLTSTAGSRALTRTGAQARFPIPAPSIRVKQGTVLPPSSAPKTGIWHCLRPPLP